MSFPRKRESWQLFIDGETFSRLCEERARASDEAISASRLTHPYFGGTFVVRSFFDNLQYLGGFDMMDNGVLQQVASRVRESPPTALQEKQPHGKEGRSHGIIACLLTLTGLLGIGGITITLRTDTALEPEVGETPSEAKSQQHPKSPDSLVQVTKPRDALAQVTKPVPRPTEKSEPPAQQLETPGVPKSAQEKSQPLPPAAEKPASKPLTPEDEGYQFGYEVGQQFRRGGVKANPNNIIAPSFITADVFRRYGPARYEQWSRGLHRGFADGETGREHERKVAEKLAALTGRSYPVTTNYSQSLEQMLAAGKYAWKDPDITAKNFPLDGKGAVDVEVVLVHFNREIRGDDAIRELKVKGLEPAKIEHCLAFGAKYPDVQRAMTIAFLGSHPDGRRFVPCLNVRARERGLCLDWLGRDWERYWRFAAVRTKK